MAFMRVHKFVSQSYVDGPGCRAVVFLQGCSLGCAGCQNTQLWPADGGMLMDPAEIAAVLMELAGPLGQVTISGGEPFQQAQGLAYLVRSLRDRGAQDILVYSGYTWEQLTSGVSGSWLWVREVLDRIQILVDGPFVRSLDHNLINWRGSSNQRPINVQASLAAGSPVLLNWDQPRIIITSDGHMLAPVGMSSLLETAAGRRSEATRRCGQTAGL